MRFVDQSEYQVGIEAAADYGGRLKEEALFTRKPIDAGGQYRLDALRYSISRRRRAVEGHAGAGAGDDATLNKKLTISSAKSALPSALLEMRLLSSSGNRSTPRRACAMREVSRGESGLSASGVTRALSAHGGV